MDFSHGNGNFRPARASPSNYRTPGSFAFRHPSVVGCLPMNSPVRFLPPMQTFGGAQPYGASNQQYPPVVHETYVQPNVPAIAAGQYVYLPFPPQGFAFQGIPSVGDGGVYFPQSQVCYENPINYNLNVRHPEQEINVNPITGMSFESPSKPCCKFCKSNGETYEIYSSHYTSVNGIVRCPILRKLICQYCGATGDNAHTQKYCSKRIFEESKGRASNQGTN